MLNHLTIMGRLCADPELRYTQTGIPVCNARIATDRDYADQNGEHETDFFDVVAWRGTAEFINNYFQKGRKIVLDGRLQSRSWTDREGKKRVSIEIVAESAYFADSKPADNAAPFQTGEAAGFQAEASAQAKRNSRKSSESAKAA